MVIFAEKTDRGVAQPGSAPEWGSGADAGGYLLKLVAGDGRTNCCSSLISVGRHSFSIAILNR